MIALFSFVPGYCPNCGLKKCSQDPLSRQDYFAGCSHTCQKCGLHYAYAEGVKILELAAATGDMGRYVKPDEVR